MALAVNTLHDDKTQLLFRTVKAEIQKIKNNSRQDIKSVICKLAHDLEGIVIIDNIALTIKNELKGLVSARFVDMCLDTKYKKDYRVENARKRVKKQHLAEVLLLESHDAIDTTDKNNIITGSSNAMEGKNFQCSKCNDLFSRIEELQSALSKASQPRNLEVIEIEFPIEISIIQNCITNTSQHWRSLPQMWFNVKVEKTSGKVISATTGRIHELILPNNQQTGRV